MNENTYWQWVIDGMGGVANMVEALASKRVKMTSAQAELLLKHARRLTEAAESQQKHKSDG